MVNLEFVTVRFSTGTGLPNWDATGKIVKERILNNELKNLRCANAWDCYVKLREQLTKDGTEDRICKLFEYEKNGDANKSEYDGLLKVSLKTNTLYTQIRGEICRKVNLDLAALGAPNAQQS